MTDRVISIRRTLLACTLLAGATLAVFWPVLNHGFTNYDDPDYITENPHVLTGPTWENVKWALSSGYASNWHPLTWVSHMLDVQMFGLAAGGPHLVNVLFHAANAILLLLLLERLTGAFWRSAFVAALFALHPMHVESVAWLAERKDVLSGFFFFLTLWTYTKYTEKSAVNRQESKVHGPESTVHSPQSTARTFYTLSLLSFALGLMSKPMLVTVPFVLLLLDYWPLGRFQLATATELKTKILKLKTLSPLLLEKIPFLVLAAASSVVTFLVQQRGESVASTMSLGMRADNALVSYCRYVGKLFYPINLCVLYPHPFYWQWMVVVLCGLALAGISVFATMQIRQRPWLFVGWWWYVGTLVPVIGLVQVGQQAMADRYSYLPSIGVFLLLAWGAREFASRLTEQLRNPERNLNRNRSASEKLQPGLRWTNTLFPAAGLAIIFVCGLLTQRQISYWKDNETLFRHALEVTRDNATAHGSLARALTDKGERDEAIGHFREALRLDARDTIAYNGLATLLAGKGQVDEAVTLLKEAIRRAPNEPIAYSNLGLVLATQGRLDEAIGQWQEAIRRKPDYAEAHNNLGVALAKKGRFDEAMQHYQQALRSRPDYAKAHKNWGIALANQGRLDEAISHFQEALRLKPDYAEAQQFLTAALRQRNGH